MSPEVKEQIKTESESSRRGGDNDEVSFKIFHHQCIVFDRPFIIDQHAIFEQPCTFDCRKIVSYQKTFDNQKRR